MSSTYRSQRRNGPSHSGGQKVQADLERRCRVNPARSAGIYRYPAPPAPPLTVGPCESFSVEQFKVETLVPVLRIYQVRQFDHVELFGHNSVVVDAEETQASDNQHKSARLDQADNCTHKAVVILIEGIYGDQLTTSVNPTRTLLTCKSIGKPIAERLPGNRIAPFRPKS
jgi:hypothetical protein